MATSLAITVRWLQAMAKQPSNQAQAIYEKGTGKCIPVMAAIIVAIMGSESSRTTAWALDREEHVALVTVTARLALASLYCSTVHLFVQQLF